MVNVVGVREQRDKFVDESKPQTQIWKSLSEFDPPFPPPQPTTTTADESTPSSGGEVLATKKRKLEKKEWQLISTAVGELYWAGDYEKVGAVCEWCDKSFEMERKMGESVERWRGKSRDRLVEAAGGNQG